MKVSSLSNAIINIPHKYDSDKNEKFFLTNPRLSMMVRILKNLNPNRKKKIFNAAQTFIEKNTCEN